MHVAIAVNPGRKGYEIADAAIMFDIGVKVRMKAAADTNVRRERHERRDERARPDLHIVHLDRVRGPHRANLDASFDAAVEQLFANSRVGDREARDAPIGRLFDEPPPRPNW